eukprot:CAMPEP_0113949624 /NCGR_PEP_ID=MMETSP1339-20121228/76491_1 /TAXON_ID=94617 /ORGANISM="Fibrocapsa japonica" /LENGTH=541 /DNA_ID=CAMNT_0000957131 /DNA_START=181 /DNA_END=1808 /DNA_ORIENTATION=+ /assembly_acc=CAM_ASM_000762
MDQTPSTPSPSNAKAGPGAGPGGDKRHRQVHGPQDPGGQAQAQPGQVRQPPGLAGDPHLLPGLGAAELLHAHPGGQPEGDHQAPVRGPHPACRAGESGGHHEEQEPEGRDGENSAGNGADASPGQGGGGFVWRGAAKVCHWRGGGARGGRVHVRRALLVPGREAEAPGRPHHPLPRRRGLWGQPLRAGGGDDLAVLDYLSDYICCLYGMPSAYGVVTMPFSTREGINIFLAGYVPTENLRFREDALTFKVSQTADDLVKGDGSNALYNYPDMTKTMSTKTSDRKFILHVEAGAFTDSEIIVMLGENGTGKTTFIRMMAGLLKSDEQKAAEDAGDEAAAEAAGVPALNVSYKPQKISPKFQGTVRQLLHKRVREAYVHPQFVSDVMKPLTIENIIDQGVQNLSGGELQRVAIVLALGKPADIYLIDEPSAYLDSEQRITCAKVMKRFIMHAKKTAFVVEHDFIMATYLADRVIVYDGQPSIETTAHAPQPLLSGMNTFLQQLSITFRRDPTNWRPRINKMDSIKDREQKAAGNFFFLDADDV